jgi:hypothetical protein
VAHGWLAGHAASGIEGVVAKQADHPYRSGVRRCGRAGRSDGARAQQCWPSWLTALLPSRRPWWWLPPGSRIRRPRELGSGCAPPGCVGVDEGVEHELAPGGGGVDGEVGVAGVEPDARAGGAARRGRARWW